MKKGQTSVGREQAAHAALYGVLAGFILILLSGAGATAAMAATCSDIHCDNPLRDSQMFRDSRIDLDADLDADNLTVTSVDHMSSDADLSVSSAALAGSAPLLYLTPRVASILEEVFDDSKGAVDVADPAIPVEREVDAQPDAVPQLQDDLQGSPVAGTGGNLGTNASDRYGPLSSVLDDPDDSILPKLQRQMYRTDI